MFTSPASCLSSSGVFQCTEGNQKTSSSETVFGSPTATANYWGTSNWAFPQKSSPLSSTTTFGAPSYAGFGSCMSALGSSVHPLGISALTSVQGFEPTGYSSSGNFTSNSFGRVNVFGPTIGMSNSHGTSTCTFNKTSSPLSTTTKFGSPSSYGLGSSTSGGPHAPRSTFVFKQSHCGGQERGSRIEIYKRTPETEFSTKKLLSISAMPVYKDKSHEELRWEDYKFTTKGGFGSSSSAVEPTSSSLPAFSSSPVTDFSRTSWGTTSISTTPVKANPFGKTFHSVASEIPTWKFPGPTSTSSSFSLAPFNHNPFITNSFTSLSNQTSSSSPSFEKFTGVIPTSPSSLNAFWSFPIGEPSTSMVTAPHNSVSGSTFNQPTTFCNPCVPSNQNYNAQIENKELPSFTATPFPPKSHLSLDASPSIQYGISSIPVKDKPSPVRYPLRTTNHLSRRNKLPVQKYDPKLNGSKMPFFTDTKEIPVPAFVPRKNPRAMVVCPAPRAITETMHEEKLSGSMYENEKDDIKAYASSNDPTEEENLLPTIRDAPSKLQLPDYYTIPQISELEIKERAEPGFCSHVKDFVIGRHGYGSIKFLGETDVRNLDLETFVQFNNRELIMYMDESKKPPVGQGLNKPAEITLLNIKCIDKRSGVRYKEGPKIDKYIEMLKKKVVAQGGEFISYLPIEGEWKFRVQHF